MWHGRSRPLLHAKVLGRRTIHHSEAACREGLAGFAPGLFLTTLHQRGRASPPFKRSPGLPLLAPSMTSMTSMGLMVLRPRCACRGHAAVIAHDA